MCKNSIDMKYTNINKIKSKETNDSQGKKEETISQIDEAIVTIIINLEFSRNKQFKYQQNYEKI